MSMPGMPARKMVRITYCPCGQDHHKTIAQLAQYVRVTDGLPPTVRVKTPDGTWIVPRIFIFCHHLFGFELPPLAVFYGFEKIAEPDGSLA